MDGNDLWPGVPKMKETRRTLGFQAAEKRPRGGFVRLIDEGVRPAHHKVNAIDADVHDRCRNGDLSPLLRARWAPRNRSQDSRFLALAGRF